jgi:hypothetical protein
MPAADGHAVHSIDTFLRLTQSHFYPVHEKTEALQRESFLLLSVSCIALYKQGAHQYNARSFEIRGYSSAGRALAWHARGQRFDPAYLHQKSFKIQVPIV